MERNTLKAFDRANIDVIDRILDDLDNDFKYLFPTPLFLVYGVDWEKINNLSTIIDRGQH